MEPSLFHFLELGAFCSIFLGLKVVTLQALWPHRGRGLVNDTAFTTCNPSRNTPIQAELSFHLLSVASTLIISSKQVLPASLLDIVL